MAFNDMLYERPDMDAVGNDLRALIADFSAASSAEDQIALVSEINRVRAHVDTMQTLCRIRHTIDTQDAFYREEQAHFDRTAPIMEGVISDYYLALISSTHRSELEAAFGSHLFQIAELAIRRFSPDIVEDLKRSNQLVTEYSTLVASAQIAFRGQELTLSQLGRYLNVPDRSVREEAANSRWAFFAAHEAEFDGIYDQLVRTRTSMARTLGHRTFTPLGYARLTRTDYGPDQVAAFREEVLAHIVPLAEKLRERQRQRIGVDKLRYFDDGFNFPSGNPVPQGDPDWIVENGRQMYRELSAETDEFFTFMPEQGFMDLLSRKGKRVGGYCTILPEARAPFIFANFNGTSADIKVLTHEAGHAFMGYLGRDTKVLEYRFPTLEAAEIHSMSMEFFTWNWMHLFFGSDAEKFRFSHLSATITNLPYLVTVDEFQHFIYEYPDASPAERRAAWRDVERRYLPHRDYEGCDYLERGGYWHQQQHIFARPFYYIDYALAQICALQFFIRMQSDADAAWRDYLGLCRLAGSRSFLQLADAANLRSPFELGCVASVAREVEDWLDRVDDRAL